MDPHIHQKTPDIVEFIRVFVQIALQDLVLDQPQLMLCIHEQAQVSLDESFQEIIHEPFQRRQFPSLAPADLLHDELREFAVLYEYDTLFIQSEGASVRRAAHL